MFVFLPCPGSTDSYVNRKQLLGPFPRTPSVESGSFQEHHLSWLVHGPDPTLGPLRACHISPSRARRLKPADTVTSQVPVRVDYADLYDVLAFFDGGVDAARTGNHDDLAEEIAMAGADWAKGFWRLDDMRACALSPFSRSTSCCTFAN